MKKSSKDAWRSLKDVSKEELVAAVAEMCAKLGIAVSGNGYSLNQAVLDERDRMFHMAKLMEEATSDKPSPETAQ